MDKKHKKYHDTIEVSVSTDQIFKNITGEELYFGIEGDEEKAREFIKCFIEEHGEVELATLYDDSIDLEYFVKDLAKRDLLTDLTKEVVDNATAETIAQRLIETGRISELLRSLPLDTVELIVSLAKHLDCATKLEIISRLSRDVSD